MDWLTWVLIIGAAYWFYNKNSTEKKVEIRVRRVSRQSTHDGEFEVEHIETYRSSQSTINHRYEPKWADDQSQLRPPIIERSPLKTVESPRPPPRLDKIDGANAYRSKAKKTTKECLNCRQIKPLSGFRYSTKNIDGYTKWCTNCLSLDNKYKICPNCKKRRLKSSFRKNSKTSDGLTKWCKNCM